MTTPPKIHHRLRETLSELCEACYFEQELLEEGGAYDRVPNPSNPAGCNDAAHAGETHEDAA